MSRAGTGIQVSPFYQRVFTGAVLWGWLAAQIVLLRQFLGHDAYLSLGTWLFQGSMWAFPVVLWVMSFIFAAKKYTQRRQRLFIATVLAVAGYSVYGGLAAAEQYVYVNYYTRNHPLTGDGYWAAFGHDWCVMIIGLALYAAALWWLHKRKQA